MQRIVLCASYTHPSREQGRICASNRTILRMQVVLKPKPSAGGIPIYMDEQPAEEKHTSAAFSKSWLQSSL